MHELFKIFRLQEDEAKKISASPDEPHQHDFEELIIGMDGVIEHFIDFQAENINTPCVCFVTKGKMHRVIPQLKDGKCDFWILRFKSELIPETTFQLYSYYHGHANVLIQKGDYFNRIISLCEMINSEMQQTIPDLGVVKHLLSALFSMIESERKKQQGDSAGLKKTQNTAFKNFLKLLEENYRKPEGVEFYAEKLFMSARNLNLICQSILHQTVTETIETRKLIEAKNLLTSTDKSISEIGFELGFSEKAYFTNVFKKKSGQTPTEFREEMNKLIS